MSWVTFIWAVVIGACATVALPHVFIGLKNKARENLLFALAALGVAGVAFGELAVMHAQTPEEIGRFLQWTHVPLFFAILGTIGFVRSYFGTGRVWLGVGVSVLRFVMLVINFAFPPNLNFREINGLRVFNFLGEPVSMPSGVVGPWTTIGQLSSLFLLIFVVDASVSLWRRGTADGRRRAAVVGGTVTLFVLVSSGLAALTHARVVDLPYLVSFPFLGVIVAMGFELSYDILRAAQTARQLRLNEAALRESNTQMSLAVSAAKLGLWVWNIPQDEIWITQEGKRLFGFPESERVEHEGFVKAVHEEDRPAMEALIRTSFVKGGEYENEYRIVRPGGEVRWMAGYGRVELDAQGKPAFMRGVTRDITKRKLAEEALRESEARFRTVADVAPVMIWMSDPNKNGVFFNKGWLQFTGRTLDQELGAGWLQGIHAEDLANTIDICGTHFRNRETFTIEYRLRDKDGEYRWLLDTGTPRFEPDGTFLGYIGSCIDITERRQAELDHQLQSTELARVGRLAVMGELAASLAHEVNNPLGAMVTNASAGQRLLSHGQLQTDELRELLADIVADGQRARQVIESVRNMVRKSESSHSLVDITDIVRDVLRIVRADAIARKVSLVAEVDPDAGIVMADRVQLLQVLLNLTMNAFEALSVVLAEARRVVIRADRVQDGTICVSVRDAGPGFPDGLADQLFEPFFSTKTEGTGMGLAIARSIIEAHGGTLSAKNSAEGGAVFTICLPEATEAKSQAA